VLQEAENDDNGKLIHDRQIYFGPSEQARFARRHRLARLGPVADGVQALAHHREPGCSRSTVAVGFATTKKPIAKR